MTHRYVQDPRRRLERCGRVLGVTAHEEAVGRTTLYVGGMFGSVGLMPTPGLAALSIPEDPIVMPPVFPLAQNVSNPAGVGTHIRFTRSTSATAMLAV